VTFGLNIINFGPAASPPSMKASVQWAEAAMLSDQVAITPDVTRPYPEPLLRAVHGHCVVSWTDFDLELGATVIIVPYRHDLLNARMTANVDRLSGGRLIVGVGARRVRSCAPATARRPR